MPMSPTAQRVAETSAARDKAMQEAYAAEGTPREAWADQEFAEADIAYQEACADHRAARRAHGDNV